MAPFPNIPDPFDDDSSGDENPQQADDEATVSQSIHTVPRASSIAEGNNLGNRQRVDLIRSSTRRLPASLLHRFPTEIRLAIYKHLLVTKKEIQVHSGWEQVYRRQQLSIPTSILRTCRGIYNEAIGVLYGRNKFLYKLRDHVPRVTDVDQVAQIDDYDTALPSNTFIQGDSEDYDEEDEEDGDSDWEEETSVSSRHQPRSTRRRTARRAVAEPDINVKKHLHLFRRITIEAEQNRYLKATKLLMASAIATFEYKQGTPDDALPAHLQMLTVRMHPRWEPTDDTNNEAGGEYTFVDFFHKQSPVIRAIRGLDFQFLRVELMGCRRGDEEVKGQTFQMDFRCSRPNNGENGIRASVWVNDVVMQIGRRCRADKAANALDSLDERFAATCKEYLKKADWSWDGIYHHDEESEDDLNLDEVDISF